MDLSEALAALTKAVEENTAELRRANGPKFDVDKAPVTPDPTPPKPAKAAKAAPKPEALAITYDGHVKPLAVRVAGRLGRDALVSLLAEFGAAKATELKPEQFADFVKRAEAELG